MSDITLRREVKMKYTNFYRCPECRIEWEDTWDSMCNDHCPQCEAEIEPYDSEEIKEEPCRTRD